MAVGQRWRVGLTAGVGLGGSGGGMIGVGVSVAVLFQAFEVMVAIGGKMFEGGVGRVLRSRGTHGRSGRRRGREGELFGERGRRRI